eukprot:358377-Chlamydomonas_euryale.AAC.9
MNARGREQVEVLARRALWARHRWYTQDELWAGSEAGGSGIMGSTALWGNSVIGKQCCGEDCIVRETALWGKQRRG